MHTRAVKLVYFSPTGTTRQVVEGIAKGIQGETIERVDLTPPEAKTREFDEFHDELAIIGAPVYGGRIPVDAVHRLRRLKADGTPAVVVVVYGNRAYEDALLELRNLALDAGFRPVAGGAFIGEHSYSNDETPIAAGRPDGEDLRKVMDFGRRIREKIEGISALEDVSPLLVPGNFPYKERGKPSRISSVTHETLCIKCGTCASVCPTAAITVGETVVTDQDECIRCCACVKNCSTGARVMEHPRIKRGAEWLYTNYSERREPETFL